MKKNLLFSMGVFTIVCFWSTVMAQSEWEPMLTTTAVICKPSISASQKSQLETASLFLKTRGGEIDALFSQKENIVAMAKSVREDLISNIDALLSCQYGIFSSYREVIAGVKDYVHQLVAMKKNYQTLLDLKPLRTTDSQILALQSHLLDILLPFVNQGSVFSQSSSWVLMASGSIPEMGSLDLNLNYDAVSTMDLQQNLMDLRAKLDATVDASDTNWFFKIAGSLNFDVAVKQYEKLFVQLLTAKAKSTSTETTSLWFFDSIQKEFSGAKTVLGDSFLEVPSSEAPEFGSFVNAARAFVALKTVPMFDFYEQKNGVYYGSIGEWACGFFEGQIKNNCLNDIQATLLENHTSVFLNTNQDNKLGFTTDLQADESMPVYLNNHPIVSWNTQRIHSVSVPFNAEKTQWMNYSADKEQFSLNFSDENASLDLSGAMKKNLIDLKWVFHWFTEKFDGFLSLSMITNPQTNLRNSDLLFTLKKSDSTLFSVSFHDQTVISFLNSFTKILPAKTMSLEEFTKAMEMMKSGN